MIKLARFEATAVGFETGFSRLRLRVRPKCLHTGHGNLDINSNIGDTVLGTAIKKII